MQLRWQRSRETRETHEKKSARVIGAKRHGLQIQQEVTEKTEARSHLRSLRCLLFKPPAVRCQPNAKLTDDEERTNGVRLAVTT